MVLLHKDAEAQKGDYKDLVGLAHTFAQQGHVVQIPPRLHEKNPLYDKIYPTRGTKFYGKCPDLIIDGKCYEYEGYERPWKKRKLSNQLLHGLKQSDRIIIDIREREVSADFIRRALGNRLRQNPELSIDELWGLSDQGLALIYKRQKADSQNESQPLRGAGRSLRRSSTDLQGKGSKKSLLARAQARHEARSPEDVARIQARWDARRAEHRRQATLARAKARHESRSAVEIERIKKRWEERSIHPALRGRQFASNKEVDEAFEKLTSEIDGDPWFVRGGLKLTDTTKAGVNGFTYMDGRISLKPDRSTAVRSVLRKIGAGKASDVTRMEADAMATFWHEITHNRNVPGNMFLTRKETDVMELMNEFVARKTLPEFYERMGVKVVPFPEFMADRDSTGYNRRVKSYDHVIQRFDLDANRVLASAKRGLFEESYKEQQDVAVSALMDGGLDKVKRLDGKPLTKTQIKKLVSMCRDGYSEMRIDAYLEREGILKKG